MHTIVQPRLCSSNMQCKQTGLIGVQALILFHEDVLQVVDLLTYEDLVVVVADFQLFTDCHPGMILYDSN